MTLPEQGVRAKISGQAEAGKSSTAQEARTVIGQLKRLRLENFLTWRSLDWRPSHPIACLIGENDSGKSNLLRAFEFLADCAQRPLQEVFHQHRSFSHLASPDSPWFCVALEGSHNFKGRSLEFSYQLKIGRSYESGPAIVEDESLVLGDYELRRESERFYAVQSGVKQPALQVSPMQTLLHLMVKVSSDQLEIARALTNNPARAFAQDLSHFVTLRLNATTMRAACEPDLPLLPTGQNLAAALDSLKFQPRIQGRLRYHPAASQGPASQSQKRRSEVVS